MQFLRAIFPLLCCPYGLMSVLGGSKCFSDCSLGSCDLQRLTAFINRQSRLCIILIGCIASGHLGKLFQRHRLETAVEARRVIPGAIGPDQVALQYSILNPDCIIEKPVATAAAACIVRLHPHHEAGPDRRTRKREATVKATRKLPRQVDSSKLKFPADVFHHHACIGILQDRYYLTLSVSGLLHLKLLL